MATMQFYEKAKVDDLLAVKQAKITASGILKGDGAGGVTAATAGTDYESAGAVRSFSAVGGQTPTVSSGVADLSTLFSGANTSLTSTIGSTIAARCQSLDPVNSSISDVIKALKGIN